MKMLSWAALAITAVVVVGVLMLADHDEDERVEELMQKTHEGQRSPYREFTRQREADMPAWQTIETLIPRFQEMSQALRQSKNEAIKGSADGYVEAVTEIATASKNRDAKAFKKAVTALGDSCGDCHFKGGAGGELDD